MNFEKLSRSLLRGVEERVFSGAQAAVFQDGGEVHLFQAGSTAWEEHAPASGALPVDEDTLFDLASVTKMVVSAPLAWSAIAQGLAKPDDPVSRWVPEWTAGTRAGVTLKQLLNHSSGLPAWIPLYQDLMGLPVEERVEAGWSAIFQTELEEAPGERVAYSDVGYMLLGLLLERCHGMPLDEAAQALIFDPLEMTSCRFVRHTAGESIVGAVASTEATAVVGGDACVAGQVHDENTWVMGGVMGHAGLFGTASDLMKFARALLACDGGGGPEWGVPPGVLRWVFSAESGSGVGSWLSGVDTPSGERSTAGLLASREPVGASVGHLGFTGTSIWIDRARRSAVVLLSNRVHPTRDNPLMRDFRVEFHTAAGECFGEPSGEVREDPVELRFPGVLLPRGGQRELHVAVRAALEAGALARGMLAGGRDVGIEHKGSVDLVTKADLACEALILDRLSSAFPRYGVLAEESGAGIGESACRWIVDPIDGTTNFSHRAPHFCVCIALEVDGQLQVGVLYDPMRDEMFTARRNHGAFLNGRRMRVSSCRSLDRALAVTGFPYDRRTVKDNNVDYFGEVIRHVQGIRRIGSAGLDLAWVAAGRLDVYWELRIKPWDMAAGMMLLHEAGGRMTDFDGSSFLRDRGDIVATCGGRVHEELVAALQNVRPGRAQGPWRGEP